VPCASIILRERRIIKVLCVCEHLSHTKQPQHQHWAKVFYMYVDAKLNIQHGDTPRAEEAPAKEWPSHVGNWNTFAADALID